MSYQVLARKWRPAKFEQMVGQSHVLHALTNALMQNRLHHAYLFSGTRGVGKTSLARLFAKGLNCEQGVTAQPCGQCASCVEIAQGRFVDLIEVDAASRTKVDDTRELLDNVQYRPSRGRYKVYLIDEVHMLSRSSFNALLKTLEEPPEHVKFLLATTDPQRLPVTVLSRCLQFNLKSLTLDEISVQLSHILKQERLSFDEGAVKLLAKAANGSMRDALSLTDQAIAFGAGQVQLAQVQTMLGTIDEHYVIVLLKALCEGDIANLMQMTDEVLSFGAEPAEVLCSLLELLHQITLTQFAPAAAQLSKYAQQIAAFAAQLTPEQVQLYYQLLLTGRKDLPHAPDPKSGLEMALLRAVAFVPEKPAKKWQAEADSAPASSVTHESGKLVLPELPAKSSGHTGESTGQGPKALEAPAPSTQQAMITDAEAESSQHVDCDDASLLSEQALILSQAESQMPAAWETKTRPEDSGQGENQPESDCDNEVSDSAQAKLEPQSQPEPEPEPEQNEVTQAANPSLFELAYADSASDSQDDLLAYGQNAQDYEAYLASQGDLPATFAPEPDHGLERTERETTESKAGELAAGDSGNTSAAQGEENVPQQAQQLTGTAGDDLLDAVLAARDSLLSDLDVDSSKESGAKKSEAEVKAYVPPKRQIHASATESDKASDDKVIEDKTQAVSASDVQASDVKASDVQANDDSEDRPPWEEKPEVSAEVNASAAGTPENTVVTEHPLASEQERDVKAKDATDKAAQVTQEPLQSQPSRQLSVSESITGDSTDLQWYRLMAALEIGGRVRQLAVNSVCQQFSDPLPLVLKPDQKHLEAPAAVAQLEEALSAALGEPCQVTFSVGVVKGRETPLEIRKRFHAELLAQAEQELVGDEHIRWLTQAMAAQLVPDSLSYAPERLGQRGQAIELIDKSNFLELA